MKLRIPSPFVILFIVCLGYCLASAAVGWGNPLLDDHAFRQTQTAISTRYLVGKTPTLAYETPVLGPPWAVPFEFPLYQWLVAGLVGVLHTPLDQTGRAVSLAFWLLCLIPTYSILKSLKVSREHALLVLSLFLVSPFYVFWSRAFLMESTALFLGACYLACALRSLEARRWASAAVVFGVLGGLVKITTFAPFFLACLLSLVCWRFRDWRAGRSPWSALLASWPMVPVLALPALAALVWTGWADGVRGANPLGAHMTGAVKEWVEWNLGTVSQRLSAETWLVILGRWGLLVGHLAVLSLVPACLLLAGRRRGEMIACLLLGLSGPLLFTNLHYVHEYYAYANGVFVLAALGLALVALLESRPDLTRLAGGGLVAVLLACLVCHRTYYYPKQSASNFEIVKVGDAVRRSTGPGDVLVVVGCDWSPEVPYYSERRALMFPGWKTLSWEELPGLVRRLEGQRVGAVVVGPGLEGHTPREVLEVVERASAAGQYEAVYATGAHSVYALRGGGDVGEQAAGR